MVLCSSVEFLFFYYFLGNCVIMLKWTSCLTVYFIPGLGSKKLCIHQGSTFNTLTTLPNWAMTILVNAHHGNVKKFSFSFVKLYTFGYFSYKLKMFCLRYTSHIFLIAWIWTVGKQEKRDICLACWLHHRGNTNLSFSLT